MEYRDEDFHHYPNRFFSRRMHHDRLALPRLELFPVIINGKESVKKKISKAR